MPNDSSKDCYDRAIDYLTKHPSEIYDAWMLTHTHTAGCLFKFATKTGLTIGFTITNDACYGCLTTIRLKHDQAQTPELTTMIQKDTRIPTDPQAITLSDLPIFAEWQRYIDKVLDRTVTAENATAE